MTKKILWLEGACGIAGDMTVAALLDLGAKRETLDAALGSLGVESFSWDVFRSESRGIAGTRFDVRLREAHGGGHHHHAHAHDGNAHRHEHAHRHLADVETILARGNMSARARELAFKAFRLVAEAEAKAHGKPVGEVHFHEVGAEDSIADIVGAHGELPVPVPAVLNIAAASSIPLRCGTARGELVTPTGIALAAAFRTRERLPEKFRVERVGIGLGTREIGKPNMLRALLLAEESAPGIVWQIAANIDDATGEMLGAATDEIFAAGALDVCFAPCFMKKNRPAYQIQILAEEARVPAVEAALFRATTTIGLRKWRTERTCMAREIVAAETPFGSVRVKRCRAEGIFRAYPEFNDVRALAEKTGLPFSEIFDAARAAAERMP